MLDGFRVDSRRNWFAFRENDLAMSHNVGGDVSLRKVGVGFAK